MTISSLLTESTNSEISESVSEENGLLPSTNDQTRLRNEEQRI